MKKLNASDPEIMDKAVEIMRRGAVTVYPTDTVYGLGTVATIENNINVKKIFKIKRRPLEKPLSVLMTLEMVSRYIEASDDIITKLKEKWPVSITFIAFLKESGLKNFSPYLNPSRNNTLAFRVPTHNLLLSIIERIDFPIIGTSANTSGHEPSVDFSEVFRNLSKSEVDLWIDQGILPKRSPSTIIDITCPNNPKLVREGDYKFDDFRS